MRGLYSAPVADPSIRLPDPDLRSRLLRALDREGRIPAALQALGPLTDRDVCVFDQPDLSLASQLLGAGAWVRSLPDVSSTSMASIPDARADVVVSGWMGFRPGGPDWDDQLAQARRALRPDGRLLVVHDYGRDEVTGLVGDQARATSLIDWSRPSGPFLSRGFRIRVIHCWWRWETQEEATELLSQAFGEAGAAVAAAMHRPRLAWKVAVYHLPMTVPDPEAARAARKAAKRQGAVDAGGDTPVARA